MSSIFDSYFKSIKKKKKKIVGQIFNSGLSFKLHTQLTRTATPEVNIRTPFQSDFEFTIPDLYVHISATAIIELVNFILDALTMFSNTHMKISRPDDLPFVCIHGKYLTQCSQHHSFKSKNNCCLSESQFMKKNDKYSIKNINVQMFESDAHLFDFKSLGIEFEMSDTNGTEEFDIWNFKLNLDSFYAACYKVIIKFS